MEIIYQTPSWDASLPILLRETWNQFECVLGLYNDLRWPVDGQVRVSFLTYKCCANAPTLER